MPSLATDLLQLGRELPLDAPLCANIDLLHQGDQQVPQGVGGLRLPGGAQRREQRDPYVLSGVAEVRGVHLDRPRPPRGHQLLGAVREQPLRQPEAAHVVQLADLGQQGVQADRARVTLEQREQRGAILVALRDQRQQPGRLTTRKLLAGYLAAGVWARTPGPFQRGRRGERERRGRDHNGRPS
jgi:hypothetical protein